MTFLKSIRIKIGRYFLRKKFSLITRDKKMINIRKATSVGILFVLEDVAMYHVIHEYITKLQEWKIQVKAIGYARNNLLTRQLLPVLTFDFFYDRNLNWFFRPRADCIENFIKIDYDICIDLSDHNSLPLKYVAALSKARLKVGKFHPDDKEIYDLMIDSGEEHDQKTFLNDIHEYLIILNPKEDV